MVTPASKRRKLDHSLQDVDVDEEAESEYESYVSGSDLELIATPKIGSIKGVTSQKAAQVPKVSRSWKEPMSTKDMYTSDMFQIQLSELLGEVRPNYDKIMVRVERTLRRLKQIIENIPARDPQPVCLDLLIIRSALTCYADLRGREVFAERYWHCYCLA